MTKEKEYNYVTDGKLLPTILRLSIPIVLSSFINTLYNLVDTYWLGKIGSNEMAAITLVTPIQNIVIQLGAGVTTAGAILLSQYMGARDQTKAKNMLAQLAVYALGLALVFSLISVAFAGPIVRWLGTDDTILMLARTYFWIVMMDLPFYIIVQLYAAVRQSQGDTKTPLYLHMVGVAINMVLDPLFMVVWRWGIAGAAWATLLAKIPGALLAFRLLTDRQKEVHLDFRRFRYDWEDLGQIIRIGLPTASGGALMQFGFLLMTRSVWQYGAQAVAAYGIGNRINGLITMPSNAMGSAVATIVGQNVGAGKWQRAERGFKQAVAMSVTFLLIGGITLSRPEMSAAAVSLFTEDQVVAQLGSEFLSVLALYCFVNGIYNSAMGLFQATGHTVITMVVDSARLWVFRFATLFVFQTLMGWGVESIWYSVVVSNALSALILLLLYSMGIWKKNKVMQASESIM